MKIKENEILEEISRKLTTLIAIMGLRGYEEESFRQKTIRLSDYGLKPSEIASTLGKPLNHITAYLSQKEGASRGKSSSLKHGR